MVSSSMVEMSQVAQRSITGGGQGGGNPGVMGAGGLREAGEEGAGGGITKRGGSRVKWEKFCNIGTIFLQ